MLSLPAPGVASARPRPGLPAAAGIAGPRPPAGVRFAPSSVVQGVCLAGALALVVAAGLIKLELPLHGDQALFLSYARDVGQGLRLYADRWDVKPPGIFAFYWMAGTLFGFTDRGVHLLELAWMTLTAAVLLAGVRPRLRQPWLAAVAPVASLGVYYAACTPHEQTQVEALAGLPTLLCVLALAAASAASARRSALAFAAGLAAGAATIFKVVFAPIFIALLVVATAAAIRRGAAPAGRHGSPGRSLAVGVVIRLWLPFAAGAGLVWAAVLAWFASEGTAGAMLWTVFVYPFSALAGVEPGPLKRLLVSLRTFVGDFAPWLVFLPLAAAPLLRRRWAQAADRPGAMRPGAMRPGAMRPGAMRPGAMRPAAAGSAWRGGTRPERPPVLLALTWTWLLAGFVVILVQRNSWWYYHFMLLAVPTGVLACVGIDRAVAWLRLRARLSAPATLGVAALLVLPAAGSLLAPLGEAANRLLPVLAGTAPPERFKDAYGDHAEAAGAASFLRTRARPGPVQVFETPLIPLLAGRAQATGIAGFIWGFLVPQQYAAEQAALLADPPAFVFVGENFEARVRTLAPAFAEQLRRDYRVVWQSRFGRWYERADTAAAPSPAPEPGRSG